jgi:hypothetical protein
MIGGYTYRHTDQQERFMKHTVEMDSGAIIYIPSFIKIGSAIQNLIWRIHKHTKSMEITQTYIHFSKIRKVMK